jgi:hypothetical protein
MNSANTDNSVIISTETSPQIIPESSGSKLKPTAKEFIPKQLPNILNQIVIPNPPAAPQLQQQPQQNMMYNLPTQISPYPITVRNFIIILF